MRPVTLLATCLVLLGLPARAAGERPSPAAFAECDARIARDPDDRQSYRCYLVAARRSGQFDDAAGALEARLALDPENALARYALATVEAARDGTRAATLYREAADGFARIGDTEDEVRAYADLASWLAGHGRLDDAGAALASARQAAERSGRKALRPPVKIVEASLAFRRGDFGRAEEILAGVEAEVFAEGGAADRSRWLSARGSVLWATNRIDEALDVFRRQAELLHATGDLYEEASARSNMALLASRLAGPHPKGSAPWQPVLRLVEEARALAERSGNRAIEAKSLLYLAQLGGSVAETRERLRAAQRILGEQGDFEDILLARRLLAESLVLHEPRDPAAGFALLHEAADLAREHGSIDAAARAAIVLASLQWRLVQDERAEPGLRAETIANSRVAMDAIEAIRDRQGADVVRARVFSRFAFFYARVVGHLLGPPRSAPTRADIELAFRVSERARAQAFLDQLEASGLLETLEQRGDASGEAALWSGIPSLTEVEAALGEDEAALSFQVANRFDASGNSLGGSWLLAHTRQGTRVYELPERRETEPHVELLLGMIDARDGSEAAGAVRIYEDLLAAALDDLPAGVTRLILVPDGALHRLPFGMLRAARDAAPLAARYRIDVVPSLTSWRRWRYGASREVRGPLLVLADPQPLPAADPAAGLGPLPYARQEARAIRRHAGRRAAVRLGRDAREGRVKEEARAGAAVLHFAAHAVVDEAHPEQSALLLAPDPGVEDGRLQPREFPELGLARRIVVLSGCSSARGPVLAGEGVLSLARSFFATGAVAVIGSLWPLRDDEAAVFFDRFYAHLAEGESLSGSLAAAQRDALAAGGPAAAWAGVVLLGDGDLVVGGIQGWRLGAWSWALCVVLGAGVLLLGVARFRRFVRRASAA